MQEVTNLEHLGDGQGSNEGLVHDLGSPRRTFSNRSGDHRHPIGSGGVTDVFEKALGVGDRSLW